MATGLTTYFAAKLSAYGDLIEGTTEKFGEAVADLATTDKAYSTAVDDLASIEREIADIRARASREDLTPADIEDLAASLREELINRRNKKAELVVLEEEVRNQRLLRDGYADVLEQYKSLKAQCDTHAEDADKRAARHTVWVSTDTNDSVAERVATATTLLAEVSDTPEPPSDPESEIADLRQLISAAADRIATIPEILRDHARSRGSLLAAGYAGQIASQMQGVEDHYVDYQVAHHGDAGTVAKRWLEYGRVESQLGDAVTGSEAKMQRALGLLKSARDATPLTASEAARLADVALAADADAIETEAERDTAIAAVSAKRMELEQAIVAAVLEDPTADPDTNTDVQTLEGELTGLEADLATKAAAHTAAHALELDTWEVAVPDHMWQALVDYDLAISLLNEIKVVDLAAARLALTTAETQLVTALGEEEASRQALAFAAAAVDTARARNKFMASQLPALQLSAVRGDV